jgi:hemoglobin/transferrin/lactoferrin receptor protein
MQVWESAEFSFSLDNIDPRFWSMKIKGKFVFQMRQTKALSCSPAPPLLPQFTFMSKSSFYLCCLLLLLSLRAPAQALLRGLVFDKHSESPLAQVSVSLLNGSYSGLTDQAGSFKIEGVPPGIYKVRFSKRGYQSVTKTVEMKKSQVYSMGAGLLPVGLGLDREELDSPHGYHRDPFGSPYAQQRISMAPWDQQQRITLTEGLAQQAIFWRIDPNYATSTVQLRGLRPHHINWNFNGIPLSPSSQRPYGWLTGALFDPLTLQKVEVQRGTGGLIYGPAGSAGTVHLHDQTPTFSGQGTEVHGQATLQGQAPSSRYGGRGQLSFHRPSLAVQAAGTWFQWRDLQAPTMGDSFPGSGFESRHAHLSGSVRLSPTHTLTMGYRRAEQRGADLSTPLRPQSWPDQRNLGRHQLGWLRLKGHYQSAWLQQLRLTVGYQRLDETRQASEPARSPVLTTQERIDTWSTRLELQSAPGAYWHIVSGVSLLNEQASSFRQEADGGNGLRRLPGSLPDGATATQVGAYSLHTFDILKLNLEAGVRAQANLHQGMAPEAAIDQWQDLQLTYNVSGMHPLSKEYQVVANLQSGYRAPSLFERGGIAPIGPGLAVPADSGLQGERSFTSEVGLKAQTQHFSGRVMFYRTFFQDRIGYQAGEYQGNSVFLGLPVYQVNNQGEGYVAGMEASVEVPVGRMVSLYGSLVYSYGENLRTDQPLPGIPPINSRLGVYLHHRLGVWSRFEWRYAGEQNRLAPLDRLDPAIVQGARAAWNIIDLQVGYDFNWGYLTVGVFNLLDTYAQPLGAGVPLPGRRVMGSVQIGF